MQIRSPHPPPPQHKGTAFVIATVEGEDPDFEHWIQNVSLHIMGRQGCQVSSFGVAKPEEIYRQTNYILTSWFQINLRSICNQWFRCLEREQPMLIYYFFYVSLFLMGSRLYNLHSIFAT